MPGYRTRAAVVNRHNWSAGKMVMTARFFKLETGHTNRGGNLSSVGRAFLAAVGLYYLSLAAVVIWGASHTPDW